jgi:hypothetical protein
VQLFFKKFAKDVVSFSVTTLIGMGGCSQRGSPCRSVNANKTDITTVVVLTIMPRNVRCHLAQECHFYQSSKLIVASGLLKV